MRNTRIYPIYTVHCIHRVYNATFMIIYYYYQIIQFEI